MPLQCGTITYSAILINLNLFRGMQPVLCVMTTDSVTSTLQRLSWDSLQERRTHNRVWMLYRICNSLVAIPPDHLKQTTVATRRYKTRYMQIRCNSCMYSQFFPSFPSAVRLWNSAISHLSASSWSCRRLISSDHAPSFYLTALHDLIS